MQIHLFNADSSIHLHTLTAADGSYSFSVRPGTYTVCESIPTGFQQSFPTSGADCSAHGGGVGYSITLTSGEVDSNNDFGNFKNATKSGVKFIDLDADGVKDAGEGCPPLPDPNNAGCQGVQIHLFNADSSIHLHTLTAADGSYSFSVRPGTYTVCESIPAGFQQSFPTSGADCSAHGGGVGYSITLTSGEVDSNNDFGNFKNATKSGVKFIDLDADGVKDAGEGCPPLPDPNNAGCQGVQIHLFNADSSIHLHTLTAADGSYSFSVRPGTYTVCESIPAGFQQSFPTSGADCSAHGGGVGYSITLTSGEVDSNNDFGNFTTATISGMKFKDADADGVKDAGEPGLGTWVIHLFNADSSVHLHTTTAADGSYSFSSLAPGTYTVCEQVSGKPGWVQSFPTSGADCTGHTHDGITPGATGYSVTVTSGGTVSGKDFGNKPASEVTVTFVPLADLPGGGDATEATLISCVDSSNQNVGSTTTNSLTTANVFTNQSSLVCTITFVDP